MKRFTEEEKQAIEACMKHIGIDGNNTLGTSSGTVERVRIDEAEYFPDVPNYWKQTRISIYNILAKDAEDYIRCYDFNGLHVIVSSAKYNGVEWLHVSFSRRSRIPDYKDIQLVRKDFIGTDKKSIMVFPEESHYVNIAETCLHLWYSEKNPIPDFDVEICGIRSI